MSSLTVSKLGRVICTLKPTWGSYRHHRFECFKGLELDLMIIFTDTGMNRLRGVILYELQAVFSVRSRKTYLANDISKQELISHVKVINSSLLH